MEETLFYNIVNSFFQNDAKPEVDRLCNGFTAVNVGTTNVVVNGITLAPPIAPQAVGESVSFGGNRNEIFYGRIDVSFPGGAGGNVIIQQKVYIEFGNNRKPFNLLK